MEQHEQTAQDALDETEIIPIAQLDNPHGKSAASSFKGVVTLVWPYSSSNKSAALLVADPDFRLRNRKGQVRVQLTGPAARAVAKAHIGIGDHLHLSLRGASWLQVKDPVNTPGRSIDAELLYDRSIQLQVYADDKPPKSIDIEQSSSPIPQSPKANESSMPIYLSDTHPHANNTWSSPARFRSSLGSQYGNPFLEEDLRADEDGFLPASGRKRLKFGMPGHQWKLFTDDVSASHESHAVRGNDTSFHGIDVLPCSPPVVEMRETPKDIPSPIVPTSSSQFQELPFTVQSPATDASPLAQPILLDSVTNPTLAHHQQTDPDIPVIPLILANTHLSQSTILPPLNNLGCSLVSPFTASLQGNPLTLSFDEAKMISRQDTDPYPLLSEHRDTSVNESSLPVVPEIFADSINEASIAVQQTPSQQMEVSSRRDSSIIEMINENLSADLMSHDFSPNETPSSQQGMTPPLKNLQMDRKDQQELEANKHVLRLSKPVSPDGQPLDNLSNIDSQSLVWQEVDVIRPENFPVEPTSPDRPTYPTRHNESLPVVAVEPKISDHQANVNDLDAEEIVDLRTIPASPTKNDSNSRSEGIPLDEDEDFHIAAKPEPSRKQRPEIPHIDTSEAQSKLNPTPLGESNASLRQAQIIGADDQQALALFVRKTIESAEVPKLELTEVFEIDDNVHADEQTPQIDAKRFVPDPHETRRLSQALQQSSPPLTSHDSQEVSQEVRQVQTRSATASHALETIASQIPPLTPQATDSSKLDRMASPTTNAIIATSHQKAVGTRKSSRLSTRVSDVPEVISPWFTSRIKAALDLPQKNSMEVVGATTVEKDSNTITDTIDTSSIQQKKGHIEKRLALENSTELDATSLSSTGFRTPLSYYAPITALETYHSASSSHGSVTVDVFAVVIKSSNKSSRAKAGPKDHYTVFSIIDPSSQSQETVVECFRPFAKSLPATDVGDIVLLREFQVRSRKRKCYLISGGASAWHIWHFSSPSPTDLEHKSKPIWASSKENNSKISDKLPREECNGPPVEVGYEEQARARQLHSWWINVRASDVSRDVDVLQSSPQK